MVGHFRANDLVDAQVQFHHVFNGELRGFAARLKAALVF
jgi:hypothetical protein